MPPLDLTVASLSDLGRSRQVQQDHVSYYIPQDPQQMARWGALYIVADGMGGHQAGDVASQGAVKHVISQYYGATLADVGTGLVHAIRSANRLIYEQAQTNPAYAGMGTTMVAAVILGRKVYIASVGDSRAYLIGPKAIRQITEDHSWVGEQLRAGLLTPEEARVHPQRNVVTRALGSKPSVEVDLFEGEISDHDILFICSDGVTGHLEDPEIAALARAHPPEEAARRMVDLANERGGHDNMSIILVSGPKAIVAARPTVASPVQPRAAAAAPVARRPVPFALAGMGAAALAVVALAVVIVLNLVKGDGGTGTDATATTAVAMVAATSTLANSPGPVTVDEPTSTPVPPGDTPAAPAPTSDAGSPLPTSTLAQPPSATPASPTTTRGTPTPTQPRSPTTTPARTSRPPECPSIKLKEPEAGDSRNGIVTFEWEPIALQSNQFYDLRFWSQIELDRGEAGRGANPPSTATRQTVNLDNLHTIVEYRHQTDAYYWGIVIVHVVGKDPEIVCKQSTTRLFYYRLPDDQSPAPEPGNGTQQPPPTPTNTPKPVLP